MYGMNFLFGNNFGFGGFGGFGCCCCRPNPFMLGAMRGYNSAMMGYAMMGAFNMPSIFGGFSPLQTQQQGYSFMPFNLGFQQSYTNNDYGNYSQDTSTVSETDKHFDEISKKWDEAFSKTKTSSSVSSETAKSTETVTSSQSSNVKGKEVKSSPDFMYKIQKIAASLNCDPNDLLSVMNAESGIDAGALNKSGKGAVGLIQFTDISIKELNNHGCNITKEELKNMDPVKQLDYVEKYLQIAKSYSFAKDAKLSAGDLYAVVFLPGRANREVLTAKGENYYESNKPLDINKDGQITKSELVQRVNKFRVSLVA